MGRFLKNSELSTGSYAIRLPVGEGVLSPDYPVDGQMRFNEANDRIEFYLNSQWNQVARIGKVQIEYDDFVGDGIETDFTLSRTVDDETDIIVTIGGVYQIPNSNYTVSGSTITFSSPPPAASLPDNPNRIVVLFNMNSTNA